MREEEIKASVEYFEILLREQLARQDIMERAAAYVHTQDHVRGKF